MSIEDLIGAKKDFLTGCFTKESLVPLFVKLGGEYQQSKKPFSILLIDLDRFKAFNDKYGHVHGDEALRYFSSSLRLSLGDLGVVPLRYGGDEFVIVFPGRDSSQTHRLSVQLEKNIKNRPFLLKGRLFKMSFSGGIASYPNHGKTIEELVNSADKAMYVSKRHGHGRITQYGKIWQVKLKRLAIIIAVMLVAISLLAITYYNKDYFPGILKKIEKAAINLIPSGKEGIKIKQKLMLKQESEPRMELIPKSAAGLDTVYLKSGGIFQGIIAYEDDSVIGIKLQLERGEASLMINKSEIEKIERARKEK